MSLNIEELGIDVSRETSDRLRVYHEELLKWTRSINLISPLTMDDAWARHFVDSAQIYRLADREAAHWVDLGSGGGFPGLVCATIAAENSPNTQFTLIESDARKCAFLRAASRAMGIKTNVICSRIEAAENISADIISARALSSLQNLLCLSVKHGTKDCQFLFPKGKNWSEEVEEAQKDWRFSLNCHSSTTNPDAVILEIRDIAHA